MAARTHAIAILAYPGAQAAAVHGLTDLFDVANRLAATAIAPLVSGASAPSRTRAISAPTQITVEHLTIDTLAARRNTPLTAIILPPALGHSLSQSPAVLTDWLTSRHREGAILCSACVGTFILAETGLLAARPATTHWALGEPFTARFPDVALDLDRLVIDDGDLITAGGIMAWVDLGLRLLERLLGPAIMVRTARYFLVDPGGREQRYYASFSPPLLHGDAEILKAQHWAHAHSHQAITQPALARRAGLSERTFLRRFVRATQLTPVAYLQQLRITRARELLELTQLSISQITDRIGYADPGAFRKLFTRLVGLTPGAYRRRFALAQGATRA